MLRHDINFKIHFPVSFLSARPAVPQGPACCPSITIGRAERGEGGLRGGRRRVKGAEAAGGGGGGGGEGEGLRGKVEGY